MAVDLNDLIDSVIREVNPPGSSLFPDATDDDWLGQLRDAFWETRLFGMLEGFTENAAARGGPAAFGEGIITPTGALLDYDILTDMPREHQQLIVLYAGYRILLNELRNIKTQARYKAGPVEYETQQSATVLKGLLDAIKERIHLALVTLSAYGATDVTVLDAVIERSHAQASGDGWWVRGL